jgi:acyl carrier protein
MAYTYEGILKHVSGYLHDTLEGSPDVQEHSRLVEDLGVDSLKAFETVGDMEDFYQIVVPLAVLQQGQIRTVADLTNAIVGLLEAKSRR